MQNWKDLYQELCELLTTKVPEVKWKDLWHNQVNFLDQEHEFPTPAVFFSFRITRAEDAGQLAQKILLQVDTYLFFETFADTFQGASNQDRAMQFLDILNKIFAALHGSQGNNYSSMRRIGLQPVDTGSSGNLYLQSFECTLMDYAAQRLTVDTTIENIEITEGAAPDQEQLPDDGNSFCIN